MTFVALCSLKGSPGVTTAALALAARWPDRAHPVLIECDPAGGDLMARFRLEITPGLVSFAAAARRDDRAEQLLEHAQILPGGLPVVIGPPGAEQARAALEELVSDGAAALRRAAGQHDTVVIADCGRVDVPSPALSVLRAADAVVLLAHARDDALARVATRLKSVARWSRWGFVLVGSGYATAEVARALRIGVLGRIPYDPKGAAALTGRPGSRATAARSALGRAGAHLSREIARATDSESEPGRAPWMGSFRLKDDSSSQGSLQRGEAAASLSGGRR